MAFTKDIVTTVVQAADIVEVVGEYVTLKRAGSNFKGLCPFHKEKTPSFVVSPDKQIFHCFGCHESGDVVGFLMKMDHLSFPEAVRTLAHRYGIHIEETHQNVQIETQRTTFFDINKRVADFYGRYLVRSHEAAPARAYLQRRGLDEATQEQWQLGYAPSSGNALVHAATKHRLDMASLEQIGVIRKKDMQYRDWFWNRVVFPICDVKGHVLAFGARALGDELPKYINSPETTLFKKSSTLYGLHLALPHLREQGHVIVLEGYMDVIALHQAGIQNAVATLGTALTLEHIAILRRYTKDVVVVFDGDTAGINASVRTVELFLNSGLNLKIASLPSDVDPDEFVRAHGADAFRSYVTQAPDGFKYLLDVFSKDVNVKSLQGKKALCSKMLPLAVQTESVFERNYIVKLVAERLGERETDIEYELKRFPRLRGKKKESESSSKETSIATPTRDFGTKAERAVVRCLLSQPSAIADAKKHINPVWIQAPDAMCIVATLFENADEYKGLNTGNLLRVIANALQDEALPSAVSALCMEESADLTVSEFIPTVASILERAYYETELRRLEKEIASDKNISQDKIHAYQTLAQKLKIRGNTLHG